MLHDRARRFGALGDPQRLRIVDRLAERGEASISELTAGAGVSRQAVTRHLAVLEEAGLVRGRAAGRERRWELDAAGLGEAEAELDRLKAAWRARLARFKLLVERED
jgi:ArsR family transcriptional regulator, cadmium/lead-responsive transcriptional repressor